MRFSPTAFLTRAISFAKCLVGYAIAAQHGLTEADSQIAHWFDVLRERVPELKHHVISMRPPTAPEVITAEERTLLRGRCMQIRSLKVFPIEAIVRGYITGSAWSE